MSAPDHPLSLLPEVFAGSVAPLPGDTRLSGIDKRPIAGPWIITATGLIGDSQADLKVHGGPEKAIHHYPREHYDTWQAEIGPHALLERGGAFGENLSTRGWTEAEICIGDTVRFGSALLQVSQGRQPCWKLNKRFDRADMAYAVQKTGRTGWYYRVLVAGRAEPGEELRLADRPHPAWPLMRLTRLLYRETMALEELAEMAELPPLAEGWRKLARRRIEAGRIEDWSARLGEQTR